MNQETQKKSYKETLNLPQTAFAMEAKLTTNEPWRLKRWQEMGLYEKIQAARADGKKWILHDGPPFANGDIHIGHVVNKTLKDVILRFRTMQGLRTPYVPGWDCHGLPIEHKIQQDLGPKLREMSTLQVRQLCHEYADKFVKIQREQFQRLGILGDWSRPYLTMSADYEGHTLEVFAKLVEQGLVYKKLKPVPWSIENQTALADAELEYQDVTDKSVYVEFPLESDPSVRLLVWTTTPWTLPANLAVAVHPDVEYGFYAVGDRTYILAKNLAEKVLNLRPNTSGVLQHTKTGRELAESGMKYVHPFIARTGRVVLAEYVTTTDGTGLVHTAPGHGEDDYETGIREKLDVYSPVLANGRFDDTAPEWIRGKKVWEANPIITQRLLDGGLLFHEENYVHSYPHDWRSKTKIIFRATEQWFVSVSKPFAVEGDANEGSLRDRAQSACSGTKEGIDFIPEWGRHRIGGMLSSRPDWCISRQRAWGLPIPVFYNEKGEALLTPQSVLAVATRFTEKGSDAWFTDSPAELLGTDFQYPAGFSAEHLRKEKDIFDVWFESGSSWNAVLKQRDYLQFPADLYLEGSDQHRGWFQLSLLPSLGATGKPPFKQVLTHGFVVKPDGTKVSKSDKEYVKAVDEINRHGADLLRLWCSSVDYQSDIPASPKALQEFGDKYRKIRNTLRYLLSNLYDFDPAKDTQTVPANSLDGWMNREVDTLIEGVTAAYDAYQLHGAFNLLHYFCTVTVSAIYANAMKDRLYCEAVSSPMRRRCQTVMHRMADVLCRLVAPMLVFTSDEAWEHIKGRRSDELESVHLAKLPIVSGMEYRNASVVWTTLMDMRSATLAQLDKLKKDVGLNKALDAEVIYRVNENLYKDLLPYGVDLEDIVGAGSHTLEIHAGGWQIEVKDRRPDYAACARSWKRRPDVGFNPEYPDLSKRDAEVMQARKE